MGTTSKGFRYPEPTDRVNEGAAAIEDLAHDVNDILGPALGAWTAFTLTNAGGSGIDLGTGAVQDCAYKKIADKTVVVRIKLTLGTGASVSGAVSLGPLPFTAKSTGGAIQIGTAILFDGTSTPTPGVATFDGTQVKSLYYATAAVNVGTPWTWNAGDQIRVAAVLELA